jgi:hypothetical protein
MAAMPSVCQVIQSPPVTLIVHAQVPYVENISAPACIRIDTENNPMETCSSKAEESLWMCMFSFASGSDP